MSSKSGALAAAALIGMGSPASARADALFDNIMGIPRIGVTR